MHVRTLSAQRYNWPVWLKLWASLFIIALCCTLYAFPRPTFYAVGIAFSLLIILHSFLRLWACLISKPSVSTAHGLSYDYPPYTVLVPLTDLCSKRTKLILFWGRFLTKHFRCLSLFTHGERANLFFYVFCNVVPDTFRRNCH